MKIHFSKTDNSEIVMKVDDTEFSPKDYILMIKEIKNNKDIEVVYDEKITPEEKASIDSMIAEINNIKNEPIKSVGAFDEDFDDLPF